MSPHGLGLGVGAGPGQGTRPVEPPATAPGLVHGEPGGMGNRPDAMSKSDDMLDPAGAGADTAAGAGAAADMYGGA